MTALNSKGILYDNGHLDRIQKALADKLNPEGRRGTLADAVKGADVLVGCSGPGVFTKEIVSTMAEKNIVFGMANPVPEMIIPYRK